MRKCSGKSCAQPQYDSNISTANTLSESLTTALKCYVVATCQSAMKIFLNLEYAKSKFTNTTLFSISFITF